MEERKKSILYSVNHIQSLKHIKAWLVFLLKLAAYWV